MGMVKMMRGCAMVTAMTAMAAIMAALYFGFIMNPRNEHRSALAMSSAMLRTRAKLTIAKQNLPKMLRSTLHAFTPGRRSLPHAGNGSLSTSGSSSSVLGLFSCDCGCCEEGIFFGCTTCCPCTPDTGPCSTRRTGRCGCCDDGYLYGCSGTCGGAGSGPCSDRSTYECGCCSSGIFYGCLGSCGDSTGTGPCSQRDSGTCGCCDQGFFWGCRGTCGGSTFSSSEFDTLVETAESLLVDMSLGFVLKPKTLAQIDIIKISYSLTADVAADSSFSDSLKLDILRTASGFIPPPYGVVIRLGWGAYDFVTTYQDTGDVWQASFAAVTNNVEADDLKLVGSALARTARSSGLLKGAVQSATRRQHREGKHKHSKLRTTSEPFLVKVSFFVNVTDQAHFDQILNDIGQEKMFSESGLNPVTYGFWDDTSTLTVGCMFIKCIPQVIVQPSSELWVNVSFTYAAASTSLTSTARDIIRTVLANVAGPPATQSDVIINSESSDSSSSTLIKAAISTKSKLYASKASQNLIASSLNTEAVKAGLGTDLFSSVSATSYFSSYTIAPLSFPSDDNSTNSSEMLNATNTSETGTSQKISADDNTRKISQEANKTNFTTTSSFSSTTTTPVQVKVTSPSTTPVMTTPEPPGMDKWKCKEGYSPFALRPDNLTCIPDPVYPLRNHYSNCTMTHSWKELVEILAHQKQVRFMTGGLGQLMIPNSIEVWVCQKNHTCTMGKDGDFFCFTFDENRKIFYPWGLMSDLKLKHTSIFSSRR
ncbi:hypothetical protein GUITHDRAFT_116332 [Guillardia theta CCMP2712]|uniref:Uncharacterized protein n=1 Tax=Guillardia theta (strain CCMP2712) TaxID=905079 RepID=L1IMM1_GUITC|nr:hypothetical protein GUITHDRAFT_116332 [Guillardia theta CCMP2712]EKX37523.1 hypothetical protein GUITHDRAFT_116332 [Guillardia theta CCMP2712]|eukprot:XP_005824503.1 hypothetical protein GUITHDRAFT_116332 [Guillardia theta CCMP2712]